MWYSVPKMRRAGRLTQRPPCPTTSLVPSRRPGHAPGGSATESPRGSLLQPKTPRFSRVLSPQGISRSDRVVDSGAVDVRFLERYTRHALDRVSPIIVKSETSSDSRLESQSLTDSKSRPCRGTGGAQVLDRFAPRRDAVPPLDELDLGHVRSTSRTRTQMPREAVRVARSLAGASTKARVSPHRKRRDVRGPRALRRMPRPRRSIDASASAALETARLRTTEPPSAPFLPSPRSFVRRRERVFGETQRAIVHCSLSPRTVI